MDDSLKILNERLARGEITPEEYETLKAKLQPIVPPSDVRPRNGTPRWVVPVVIVILGLMGVGYLMRDGSVSERDLEQIATAFNEGAEGQRGNRQASAGDAASALSPFTADVNERVVYLAYQYSGDLNRLDRTAVSRMYDRLTQEWCGKALTAKVARSPDHGVVIRIDKLDLFDSYPGPITDWNERRLTCNG